MKTKHSFTPPQQLVDKWVAMFEHCDDINVLTEVAQWGADQELDACCEWIYKLMDRGLEWSMDLRVSRRPKPPSLKEQALAEPEPKGPTDKDLSDLWSWAAGQDQGPWPTQQHCFARAVLARWGNRQGILDRSTLQPPACQPHFSKSDQLMQNLNQHNQQKLTKFQLNTQSRLNGISCPECQHELMDSNPSVCLASWPPQYRVHCPNCGYIGCRY